MERFSRNQAQPMEIDRGDTSNNALRRKRNRLSLMNSDEFVELENAFRGILKTYFLRNLSVIKDVCLLLTNNIDKMKTIIQNILSEHCALKFNILVECTYVRPRTDEVQARAFKTTNVTVFQATNIKDRLYSMFRKICVEENEYQAKGSGWTLLTVDGVMLRVSKYRPLGGTSFLPLPKSIALKRAVINPRNFADSKCFQWAILSRYVPVSNKGVINARYRNLCNKFNFDNIQFPTSLKQIKQFEKQNLGVSVNVYGLDLKNQVYPLRVCKGEKLNHFDLLLLSNSSGINHYCYIFNFSHLVSRQVTKHKESNVFCKRCFAKYTGKDKDTKLASHKIDCDSKKPVRVIMPCDGDNPKILKFSNFHYKYRIPIVAYADFECILKQVNQRQSKCTFVNDVHEPMSFCVYLVCDESLPAGLKRVIPREPYIYRGVNAAEHFMEYITHLTNSIGEFLNVNIPMSPLTELERIRVENATICESCNVEFSLLNFAVRDHCHLTGKFRSVLCNSCNLKRQNQRFLPVFIHGSSNYDTHFIVRQLHLDNEPIEVIPNTSEKYISFVKHTQSKLKLRFLDSFRFLSDSLARLVSNLPKDKFLHTGRFFRADDMLYVTRKGVYPYEYTNSWAKLDETSLPSKVDFHSKLNETEISDEEYTFAKEVWDRFNCKTLGDYSDLYLKTDVLLLCDVFENFRTICMQNYDVDPAYYFTVPSLTFDVMLKFTKVELELLSDYDKYLFIEKGIRGGITSCIKRHAKANNAHLESSYDKSKESSYLSYIDANNLYGYSMVDFIPQNGFKWLSRNKIKKFDVLKIPDDCEQGYIIECDVAYPSFLHNYQNDLPFLPEKLCPPNSKQEKLLLTLDNKTRYVCHYRNLKQALNYGLVLQNIHRVLKFNQSRWLKSYIDFNTEKRKNANNDFEKDFYKLLNNAMFGKSIENVRNRMDLSLVNSERRLNKLISKPTFLNRIIYNENLCAIECAQEIVHLDKPIYIGFTVLELSKLHMYKFHYSVIKQFYKNSKVNLLYIDTDSLFYETFTDNLYSDFNRLKQYLDLSDYDPKHMCFDMTNKKKLGCFKDECCGVVIEEFIGLRPKLYTFRTNNDNFLEKSKKMKLKKAKGVSKTVVSNHINFQDYKNCLFQYVNSNSREVRRQMRLFRSKKHIVETITVNKVALSANDDKRCINRDGITTLAYGHYLLANEPQLVYNYE